MIQMMETGAFGRHESGILPEHLFALRILANYVLAG